MTTNIKVLDYGIARRCGVPAAAFEVLNKAPAMNAVPDLTDWGRPLVFQNLSGFGDNPAVETRGYLATDGKNIYMAIRCDDPAAKEIASLPVPPDGDVWAGDCAEFMLLPGYDPAGAYYHLAVNPAGSLYDARVKDKSWNSGARVFTAVDAAGWVAVVQVPLAALGLKEGEAPALWRVNLYRFRPARAGAPALDLAWSPTGSDQNHVPTRFGVAALEHGRAPDAAALKAWLGQEALRWGRNPRPALKTDPKAGSRSAYDAMIADLGALPFSFVYDDKVYNGFPAETFRQVEHRRSVHGKKETNLFVLKAGDLQVTVDTAFYAGYGAYEWTVWFENIGTRNAGVISDMRAADMTLAGARPVLKGILGDHLHLYRPYVRSLEEAPVHFRSVKGRPTHIWFPYFNLEHGDGGTLIALGWGGTWEARFSTDGNGCTRFVASGTNDLCTYLKPGEKIRSPLMSFLPYTVRDENHATNLWRRWFLDCNLPKLNAKGDTVKPFSTTWLAGDTGLPNSDGSISERHSTWKPSLEKMFAEGLKFDYRWFDAGWYCAPDRSTVPSDWAGTIGTWEIDAAKWPGNSFRESVEFGHAHGMKTLVWFEPERVTHVDDLVKNWGYKKEWVIDVGAKAWPVNNIGDEACYRWTLGRILTFMEKHDVDMYREDNNNNPRAAWDALAVTEGENRAGIAENKSVVAHYRLWDDIIAWCAKNGKDTFVDSCASGGGRNDLESLRRGIPLMRSDADRTTTALRLSMGTAFNRWVPFQGANTVEQAEQLEVTARRDVYTFRASYTPILNLSAQWSQNPKTDFDLIRFGVREWGTVKDYLLKDFYLLTPWNGPEDKTHWTSYVYFDPEKDSGVLFAFRMEEAKEVSYSHRLTMLKPGQMYELRDADKGVLGTFKGGDLAKGYTVTHPQPRSAALIHIRPVRKDTP